MAAKKQNGHPLLLCRGDNGRDISRVFREVPIPRSVAHHGTLRAVALLAESRRARRYLSACPCACTYFFPARLIARCFSRRRISMKREHHHPAGKNAHQTNVEAFSLCRLICSCCCVLTAMDAGSHESKVAERPQMRVSQPYTNQPYITGKQKTSATLRVSQGSQGRLLACSNHQPPFAYLAFELQREWSCITPGLIAEA